MNLTKTDTKLFKNKDRFNLTPTAKVPDPPYDDCNTLPANATFCIGFNGYVKNTPSNFTGYITTFAYKSNDTKLKLQIAVDSYKSFVYVRNIWGNSDSAWTEWVQLSNKSEIINLQNSINDLHKKVALRIHTSIPFTNKSYIAGNNGLYSKHESENLSASDFITIDNSTGYIIVSSIGMATSDLRGIAAYDKNKNFTHGFTYVYSMNPASFQFDLESGDKYVRFSYTGNYSDTSLVEVYEYKDNTKDSSDDTEEKNYATVEQLASYLLKSKSDLFNFGYKEGSMFNLTPTAVTPDPPYDDCNTLPNNAMYVIGYKNYIKNVPTDNFFGYIICLSKQSSDKTIRLQIAISIYTTGIYTRNIWGLADSTWTEWTKVPTMADINSALSSIKTNNLVGYMRMFHSIAVCGDSLSSGEIVRVVEGTNKYFDRYNFSWLANIARRNGLEWKCFSQGGATALSWLNAWKDKLLAEETPRDCYFIALATNDSGKKPYELGTITDDSSQTTFIGYYKKIIETIQNFAPKAVIFACSTYSKSNSGLDSYSKAISQMADLYDKCYFINIREKSSFNLGGDDSAYCVGGHFTTQGYVKIANEIERLVEEVINDNLSDFNDFGVDAYS